MKKFLALLLALVMVLGLFAGCSNQKKKSTKKKSSSKKDKETSSATEDTDSTDGTGSTDSTGSTNGIAIDPDKKPVIAPTQAQPSGGTVRPYPGTVAGVPVGTLLDEPEKLFDSANVNQIDFTVEMEEDGNAAILHFIIVADANGSGGVVYVGKGDPAKDEVVFEMTGNTLTKYTRQNNATKFTKDTTSGQQLLRSEFGQIADIVQIFNACQDAFHDIQFRKRNAPTRHTTGPVYAYDVIYEGEVDGMALINQETGLLVKIEGYAGNFNYNMIGFKLSDVRLPSYK